MLANIGLNVPLLRLKFASNAFDEADLVTVVVYDCVVVPSCAVTNILMVLLPTFSATGDDVALPFIVTVALASAVVGVTVTDVVALLTDVV